MCKCYTVCVRFTWSIFGEVKLRFINSLSTYLLSIDYLPEAVWDTENIQATQATCWRHDMCNFVRHQEKTLHIDKLFDEKKPIGMVRDLNYSKNQLGEAERETQSRQRKSGLHVSQENKELVCSKRSWVGCDWETTIKFTHMGPFVVFTSIT